LAEGLPAAIVIEMWRPNTDESALQGRLGAVAATVIDGETASRCAKKGSCWFTFVLGPFLARGAYLKEKPGMLFHWSPPPNPLVHPS